MLHQFLAILFITTGTFELILIAEVVLTIWRFMIRANTVIEMYPEFKEILKRDFLKDDKIEVTYSNRFYNYNTREVSIKFEKIVKEALEYYDKLGWIAIADNSLKVQQKELLRICYEIRIMRWQKQ